MLPERPTGAAVEAPRWHRGRGCLTLGEGRGRAAAPRRSPGGHPRTCQRTTCHPGGHAHAHSPFPTSVQLGNTTGTAGQHGPAWVRAALALDKSFTPWGLSYPLKTPASRPKVERPAHRGQKRAASCLQLQRDTAAGL